MPELAEMLASPRHHDARRGRLEQPYAEHASAVFTFAARGYLWDPATAVVFLSAAAGAGPSAETCCNDLNFFTTPASAHT